MPYTPDATNVAQPTDSGVLAATAAAEFREIKTYMASVLLAGIASKVTSGGALGIPSSGTLTNCTGLPIASGVSGLAANVATFLATPTSANLRAAVTDESGAGALLFTDSALGTPISGVMTNVTGVAAGLTAGEATVGLGLKSATTSVSVSGAAAPTVGQLLTAINGTSASWQDPAASATALDGITSATAAATLANTDFAIAWNWKLTTAAKSGLSIGETTASTGGAGAQWLADIGTLAASTAGPLRVRARALSVLSVAPEGKIDIGSLNVSVSGSTADSAINIQTGNGSGASAGGVLTLSGGSGGTSGAGGIVNVTGGTGGSTGGLGGAVNVSGGVGSANTGGGAATLAGGNSGGGSTAGGAASVQGGAGTGTGAGGAITVIGGASGSGATGNGGAITVTGGAAASTTGNGGAVTVAAGARAGTGVGAAVSITASNGSGGVGGDVNITTGTGTTSGRVNFTNSNVANAAVAVTLGSTGPTGSTAGAPQGWLAIKIAGTARYMPYW